MRQTDELIIASPGFGSASQGTEEEGDELIFCSQEESVTEGTSAGLQGWQGWWWIVLGTATESGTLEPSQYFSDALDFPFAARSQSLSKCPCYCRDTLAENKVDVLGRIPPNMCCAGSASNPVAPMTWSLVWLCT